MRRERIRLLVALAMCSPPLVSSAQRLRSSSIERDLARYPAAVVDRPLTLPQGILQISAPLGVSLSSGSGGEPTFFNPNISYGVSDQLTVAIRHFLGLCFSGEDGNCPEFYNDLGVDAVYSVLRTGRLDLALGAAVNLAPITNPTAVSGELRIPLKFGGGMFALVLSPTVNFGVNKRDDDVTNRKRYAVAFNAGAYDVIIPAETAPNREMLRLPLTFQMQTARNVALLVGASIDGDLDPPAGDFSDVYRIPLMAGVLFAPRPFLDLGAALTFPDLAGQEGTADDRFLSAFATLRM